jgi:hypothetical protein
MRIDGIGVDTAGTTQRNCRRDAIYNIDPVTGYYVRVNGGGRTCKTERTPSRIARLFGLDRCGPEGFYFTPKKSAPDAS